MTQQKRTADTAPVDTPILVWVGDKSELTGKPVGWRMGKCWRWHGADPQLYGDGLNGSWDIRYWHPLPDSIEDED